MKSRRLVSAGLLGLFLAATASAADDASDLLDKALALLVRDGHMGDTSAAERYLHAVLERNPDHLEARWQLLSIAIGSLANTSLSERVPMLAVLSPEFDRLATLARAAKQQAFLHYMTATHAGLYGAHERALSEIDRALALEPLSARYLALKGRLHAEYGRWSRSDPEIETGIRILRAAREMSRTHPGPLVRDAPYDFNIASAIERLSRPRWSEVVAHYERFLERSGHSTLDAYAWNNLSIAHRWLGACDRARDAADRALAIMTFGAARAAKRNAEFCLEMQKSGLAAKRGE